MMGALLFSVRKSVAVSKRKPETFIILHSAVGKGEEL